MLFENVKAILEKGKEKEVDLLVARDMLVSENPQNIEGLEKAGVFLRYHYEPITKCWKNNDEETMKKLCELMEAGDIKEFQKLENSVMIDND